MGFRIDDLMLSSFSRSITISRSGLNNIFCFSFDLSCERVLH